MVISSVTQKLMKYTVVNENYIDYDLDIKMQPSRTEADQNMIKIGDKRRTVKPPVKYSDVFREE